ncbi:hypothetical protein [Burkholderia sola]|uniref:hypothetical protein n=1 Tax=Burkholderia sola TaxID=2843302 RepID=UPI00339032C0
MTNQSDSQIERAPHWTTDFAWLVALQDASWRVACTMLAALNRTALTRHGGHVLKGAQHEHEKFDQSENGDYMNMLVRHADKDNTKSVALLNVILAGSICLRPAIAQERPYTNADGSRTGSLEQAALSWANDNEFKASWAAGGMQAQYANAMGFTGAGVKVGVLDSGVDTAHSELSTVEQIKSVTPESPPI